MGAEWELRRRKIISGSLLSDIDRVMKEGSFLKPSGIGCRKVTR